MSQLTHSRSAAYLAQGGYCCYCCLPMPEPGQHEATAARLGLSPKIARAIECTAEHLHAKGEGGTEGQANIVAAHRVCNERRHRQPQHVLEPEVMFDSAVKQVAAGGWHRRRILTALLKM